MSGSVVVPQAGVAGERWSWDLNPGDLAPPLSPQALVKREGTLYSGCPPADKSLLSCSQDAPNSGDH